MNISSVRYINLAKNWHRRLMIRSTLKDLNCPVIRSPGVVYEHGKPELEKYLVNGVEDYLFDAKRKTGVVGCWIAHIRALESIREREGITVIVEDDFICAPNFFDVAMQMVSEFTEPFDIIVFDAWGEGPLEEHKIKHNIYSPNNCSYPYYGGTHCLFINNAGISRIIKAALKSKIKDYDGHLFRSEGFISYIFYTSLCGTRRLGSDISPESGNNQYLEVFRYLKNMAIMFWKKRRKWAEYTWD